MDGPAISFGPFRLFVAQRLLLEGDTPARLGNRAFDILTALVERAGEIVSVAFFLNVTANFVFGPAERVAGSAEFGRHATVALAAVTLGGAMFDWLRFSSLRFARDSEGCKQVAAALIALATDLALLHFGAPRGARMRSTAPIRSVSRSRRQLDDRVAQPGRAAQGARNRHHRSGDAGHGAGDSAAQRLRIFQPSPPCWR